MFRLSALVLLAASAALAAPVPKEGKKNELYFPTAVGAKKVMQMKAGDTTREMTEVVTKVEEKDGVYTVTTETDQGNGVTLTNVFEVSAKGVAHRGINGQEQKTPAAVVKVGGKPGDTWETEVPGPGRASAKRTYTQGKEEEVTVPAGKYKAVRVDSETTPGAGPASKNSLWYAPGVGVVKSVVKLGNREFNTELKEFTPGKVEKKDEPKKDK